MYHHVKIFQKRELGLYLGMKSILSNSSSSNLKSCHTYVMFKWLFKNFVNVQMSMSCLDNFTNINRIEFHLVAW